MAFAPCPHLTFAALSHPPPTWGRNSVRLPRLASQHNFQLRDGLLFHACYESGLRVWDTRARPVQEVGYFDTYPSRDRPGINGAWGVYVSFTPSHPPGDKSHYLDTWHSAPAGTKWSTAQDV